MGRRIFLIHPERWAGLLFAIFLVAAYVPQTMASSGCTSTGGGVSISLPDILIDPAHALQGGRLYESPSYGIAYTCINNTSSRLYIKTTVNGVQSLSGQLKKAGLSMQIVLPDLGGETGFDITESKDFSSIYTINPGESFRGGYLTFKLRIVKQGTFTGVAKISFPAVKNLIGVSLGPGTDTAGMDGNAFYVESIPSCFGRVEINPSTISFGHIYTFQSSVNKQASFTVTASRNTDTSCLKPGDNDSYDWFDLYSTFTSTSGNALMDGNKSLWLTDSKGTLNGLKLSLQDESAATVLFNTSSTFGKLWKDTGSNNASLTKRYTARLNLTGQPLVTGPFSAGVVVTITYQ